MSGPTPTGVELVDVEVPLPEIWTHHALGADELAAAEEELVALLGEQVDDPEAVAAESIEEFMEKVGAGSAPMMIASFREVMSDESILSASLIVSKNELSGSLEPWREAYGDDALEVDVLGEPALRIEEHSNVAAGDIFDGPVQIVTWRYVVPFDARSVLMFAFSTPNHELADSLLEHVEMIMSGVSVSLSDHASGEDPANTDSTASN